MLKYIQKCLFVFSNPLSYPYSEIFRSLSGSCIYWKKFIRSWNKIREKIKVESVYKNLECTPVVEQPQLNLNLLPRPQNTLLHSLRLRYTTSSVFLFASLFHVSLYIHLYWIWGTFTNCHFISFNSWSSLSKLFFLLQSSLWHIYSNKSSNLTAIIGQIRER